MFVKSSHIIIIIVFIINCYLSYCMNDDEVSKLFISFNKTIPYRQIVNVMSLTDDCINVSYENEENKSNTIEGDLPLEKLLKLSKSFKNDVAKNLNIFKEEKTTMLNEISGMNLTNFTPLTAANNENSDETTINNSQQTFSLKQQKDVDFSCWRECGKMLHILEQEINLRNSSLVQPNENEFEIKQRKEDTCMCMSSVQNKISELQQVLNINQTIHENSNFFKRILQIENKCQHWMDKYDELHDRYLRLESKCVNIEKENCSYQMELTRIKIIEDENSRLNQTIDKSNRVRKELESALESCHEEIKKHKIEVEIARNKVKESVQMVEKICLEKERLATNLKKSNEEIVRLGNELKNLIQEAGKKVNSEVEKIKNMYKDKLREANFEIEFLRTEKQIVSNKTQQMSREYDILNEKYASINQKHANEPDIYSKKVSLLVQQIKEYEVTFNNLIADIEILKEKNTKLQESYARKQTKYIMEISFLRNTIKSLENNLNEAIIEIAEDNENIVAAKDIIKTLEMKISKLKPENNFEQKDMQIEKLTNHIETQKQLIERWRIEMNNMIEAFKKKINKLKQQCSILNKKNIKLKRMINNAKINYSTYNRKKISNSRKHKKYNRSNHSSLSTST